MSASNYKASLMALSKLISFLLLTILVFTVSGCGGDPATVAPPPPQKQEYSIADLAEIAGQSIAYIEAEDSDFPDYYWFGSGFVISDDGLVATNYHVLEGATRITIEIDGQIYDQVRVLAANEHWDLAILKIENALLKPLPMAESIDRSRLGEQVIAMGNPEGFKRTVSDGIISTLYRNLDGFDYDHIQTSAPISKGSSGGPLMNMKGEVIGVNTLTYLTGQNINFAVPIDLVHALMAELGQPRSVADVFASGFQVSYDYYEHDQGDFAVVLSWEDDLDLDLEIWTADFEFLGTAAMLNDSPDISHGAMGEEWFVFGENRSPADDITLDFSTGCYIVSVYYWGPAPLEGSGQTKAELAIVFPNGTRETIIAEELWYSPPYDYWFALLIDADTQEYKVLDFFFDAPLIAMLEWDSTENLNLVIWDQTDDLLYYPDRFWYGNDFMDGNLGLEIFRFGTFNEGDVTYDFSSGLVDVLVYMVNIGPSPTTATLTFVTEDFYLSRFEHTSIPDSRGAYFWIVVSDLDLATLDYYEPGPDENRLFLDQ